jgi:hypothetical protein
MSCDDIGNFAASVVEGKSKGATYKQAQAKIDKIVTKGYKVERKNLKEIVRVIYKEEYGKHLSAEGAQAAFSAECTASR